LVVAILTLALAGCGAGKDQGAEQTEAMESSAEAVNTPASDPSAAMEAPSDEMTSDEVVSDDLASADVTSDDLAVSDEGGIVGVDTSGLQDAPPWKLYDLAGNAVSSDQFKGQVVLVDFWATWCGPCRKSIPDLIELYNEYKDQGLVVVGMSLDQKGPSVVEPFVAQMKIGYPIVMGNQQVVQDFGGVRGIPTAFVISQDGKIYQKYVGLRPKAVFEKDIKDLLGLPS
jgi:thiol-disulfide isomerase/thioredoxin